MLKAVNLHKKFGASMVLSGVDFELAQGSSCAIIGRSGEGKSTLLHILGTLESQDAGNVSLEGEVFSHANWESIRKNHIGFIFQNFNVLEDFSVLDNLKIAAMIRGRGFDKDKIIELLKEVHLDNKLHTFAKVLSGGEKQRLAIVRALMHNPKIILADEPTGSLDQVQAKLIEELLINRVKTGKTSLIIVTHDLELAAKCDRILHLKDGKLREQL